MGGTDGVVADRGLEGSMFKRQVELRSEPVGRVVVLGESTTWGYSVSSKEKCWVNQVVRMLEEFYGGKSSLSTRV